MDVMFTLLLLVCLAVVAAIGTLVLLGAFLSAAQAQRGRQDAAVSGCEDALKRRRVLLASVIE